jgi:hypothetical protein
MTSSVVVLEFNELCPDLMDRFIAEGALPNFARLRADSLVATTDAGEQPPALEPWVQWVTIHTGLPLSEHGVFTLDEGAKLDKPRIWDVVSQAGEPVWVCGSMNAGRPGPDLNGWFLPDPWSSQAEAHPRELQPFFRFVSAYVQEHESGRPPLSPADHARFVAFMARHGLSVTTLRAIARQLLRERTGPERWRRATLLDRLQWDLFRAGYKALKPRFATFFANSTAHFQHYHWREMEPERFGIRPSDEAAAAYRDAIRYGYQSMDALVGECLRLVAPDTAIVLATGLSQQPLVEYDAGGGKQVFKTDMQKVADYLHMPRNFEVTPVMAEEFWIRFPTAEAAAEAEGRLNALRTESGAPVLRTRREGEALFAGCDVFSPPPREARVYSPDRNESALFYDLFSPLGGLKSGRHHPDGILWIRAGGVEPRRVARKVALTEVAPSLLALCGLPPSRVFPQPAMPELAGGTVAATSDAEALSQVA